MPRNVRGVRSRGVQDAEDIRKLRDEERRRKTKDAKTWFGMIGLTVIEFILCILCFIFGYLYYHNVLKYRNDNLVKHHAKSVRYILLPPAPLAISSVFLTLTYVDLISWKSVRPITYFGWIMVSTAGFLCFFLYSGVILLTNDSVTSILGIILGVITGLVFLGDLICMLVSLKRFPAPYWVLKRRSDKMDQCVCTELVAEDKEVPERPICRCGDHWGEPCICDKTEFSCNCGADKSGKQPCECFECAAQVKEQDLASECNYKSESLYDAMSGKSGRKPTMSSGSQSIYDTRKSSYGSRKSSMVGPSIVEAKHKTIANQSSLSLFEEQIGPLDYCSQATPGFYCTDAPNHQGTRPSRATLISLHGSRTITPSQIAVARSLQSPSHRLSKRSSINSATQSRASMAPSTMSAKHSIQHEALSEQLGPPSMALSSRRSKQLQNVPRKSSMAYSVYSTGLDNEKLVRESIAAKYEENKPIYFYENEQVKKFFGNSSSEEEIGEGDSPRKKIVVADINFNNSPREKQTRNIRPRLRYTESNYSENDTRLLSEPKGDRIETNLPGQTLNIENSQRRWKRNVSVSARERKRPLDESPRSESELRPKSLEEELGHSRIVRNLSTTVKAVRILSKVMEADNESKSNKSTDGFPSDSTITLHKRHSKDSLEKKWGSP